MMNSLLLLVMLTSTTNVGQSPTSGLRSTALKLKLNLGTCASAQQLRDHADGGQLEDAIAKNFTLMEPENDLKPRAIWNGIGDYNFSNADVIVGAPGEKGWAAQHGLKVRGHVLIYANDRGYTIPPWLLKMESSLTADQARDILRDYIHAVVGRYKGKIAMWDVVNEAIDDAPNTRPFNLRDSFWFRKLGPQFIALACQFAHEADPKAELYYNEYGVEGGGKKAQSLLALADFLKQQKAPLTGIGLQYHLWLEEKVGPGDGHYQLLDEIKKRNLAFMITELDLGIPVVQKPAGDPEFGIQPLHASDLDVQAEHYVSVFKMAMSYPNCHGIQMWGVTDKHSWIPQYSRGKGAALILDADYKEKPAYKAIEELLRSRVH